MRRTRASVATIPVTQEEEVDETSRRVRGVGGRMVWVGLIVRRRRGVLGRGDGYGIANLQIKTRGMRAARWKVFGARGARWSDENVLAPVEDCCQLHGVPGEGVGAGLDRGGGWGGWRG